MAYVRILGRAIDVSFSRAEKVTGLLRDIRVPLASVEGVEVVPVGFAGARGLRLLGSSVPGFIKLGTWRAPGSRQLVCVRRGQAAVRLRLRGERYTELVLGADDAPGLAAEVERARR